MKTCMLYKDVRIYVLEQMPVVGEVQEVGTGTGSRDTGANKEKTQEKGLVLVGR